MSSKQTLRTILYMSKMKKLFPFIVFAFLMSVSLSAQMSGTATDNIVPNPSFEKLSSTPIGWFYKGKHFTSVMKYWSAATAASPDVFGPKVRVPAMWAAKGFGDQKAQDGESMAGITVYGCEDGKPHCREYVQIQLKEPLVIGQTYYVEYWVSHLPRSLRVNNIGAYFSTEKFDVKMDIPLELTAQVSATDLLACPANQWIKVSGRFKADEEAEYLVLGNFCPDTLTTTKRVISNSLNYAYYYVDNVKVQKEEPLIKVPIKEDDLSRVSLEEGKVIPLKNIFFDLDKSELLPRSFVELNKLYQLMNDHPSMVIEISGHTDSMGDFDYNLSLSRKRAEAVVDFLVNKGINANRTLYRGYGSTKPISENATESGRQLNRRVEFLVVHK